MSSLPKYRVAACHRIRAKRPLISGAICAATSLLLLGCNDVSAPGHPHNQATAAALLDTTGRAIPAFPDLPDISEVRTTTEHIPADVSDAELVKAIRLAGGVAQIGIKPARARRTRDSGVFPAMSRAEALAARYELASHGAKLVQTFRSMAAVVVVIEPELAPVLRRLPIVNYLEAGGRYSLGQATPPQDTAWGVRSIGMHWVWGFDWSRGQYANITVLDTGSDEIHRTSTAGDGPANNFFECWYVASQFSSCNDDVGHGAHVAGIAAGLDNQFGFIGIAPEASSTATVKVCGPVECPSLAIATGLDWTAVNGRPRQIVNMSLQRCSSENLIAEAIARSAAAGNLLIAIAGNDDGPFGCAGVAYPGRYPEVIAVSGILTDNSFAARPTPAPCQNMGSLSGPEVELSAPFWAPSMWLGGTYAVKCGTSMAAPVVAGVAALVWSKFPQYTAQQVRARLNSTAIDLGPAGRDNQFGHGKVSAAWALVMSGGPYPTAPGMTGPTEVQPYSMCQWYGDAGTDPVPPVTYGWEVDGQQQPYHGPDFFYSAGAASFTIVFKLIDATTRVWTVNRHVTVSTTAPPCGEPA
jgi:subtilisin family serine protease